MRMPKPEINEEKCFGCMNCTVVCPMGVLLEPDVSIYEYAYCVLIVTPKKCTGCKRCVKACPYDAIRILEARCVTF